jgi:hypothetical protein
MLLLSSGKSALKEPNEMVWSQVHSFISKAERDQEREDNNNTVKNDHLRTPPRCRFHTSIST